MNSWLNHRFFQRVPLFVFLMLVGLGMTVRTADAAEMKLTLIYASNEDRAALDNRLDGIEFKLRKLFRFEHYGLIDQQTILFSPPGQIQARFPDGYVLSIVADQGKSHNFRAKLEWLKGSTPLMSLGAHLRRGHPTILGGPPYKNGNLILNIELE